MLFFACSGQSGQLCLNDSYNGDIHAHLKASKPALYARINVASLLKIYSATESQASRVNVRGRQYSVTERRRLSHSPGPP